MFFAFLALFLFSSFRFDVGVDYLNYKAIYETSGDSQELIKIGFYINEIGFIYLIKFLNFIGLGSQFMLMMYSFFTIYLVLKFIDKFAINYKVALLTYAFIPVFYLTSFNAVRQSAAISLFAYSIIFIYERKQWHYYFSILAGAFFFHLSLLLMLPIYYYANIKLTRFKEFIMICSSVCLGFILSFLLSLTPYNIHLEDVESELNLVVFLFIIVFFFITWNRRYLIKSKKLNILYNIGFLTILVFILMFENRNIGANLFLRLNNYFIVVYLVFLGTLPSLFKGNDLKITASVFITGGVALLYLKTIIISGSYYHLVPYIFNVNYFFK